MRDGIYQVTFTTSNGTLGEGVCFFRGDRYVGADFLHSYAGVVTQVGDEVQVTMHCVRQQHAVPQMPLPPEFDLNWTGSENTAGFFLQAPLPAGVVMSATGVRLRD